MRWLSLFLLFVSLPALAQFEIGGGRGMAFDCGQLDRQILRDWSSVKELMAPNREERKRPSSRDFQCVDPGYTRGLVQIRSVGGGGLRCYASAQSGGRGLCCDIDMGACSMYSPR